VAIETRQQQLRESSLVYWILEEHAGVATTQAQIENLYRTNDGVLKKHLTQLRHRGGLGQRGRLGTCGREESHSNKLEATGNGTKLLEKLPQLFDV